VRLRGSSRREENIVIQKPSAMPSFKIDLSNPDLVAKLTRLNKLEWAMEQAITIPMFGKKTGLDAIVGLLPGGDFLMGIVGSYIIVEAVHARAPKRLIARMLWNLGVDTAIGSIPVAGDLFDFFYSSNSKNLKLLKAHLEKHALVPDQSRTGAPPTGVTAIARRSGAPGRAQVA
jgi:hypothetical protein